MRIPARVAAHVDRAYELGFGVMWLSAAVGLLVVLLAARTRKDAPRLVSGS